MLKFTPHVDLSMILPHFEDMVAEFRRVGESVKGKAYDITSFFIPIISDRIDYWIGVEIKKRGIPPEIVGYIPQDPTLRNTLENISITAIKGMTEQGVQKLEILIRKVILAGGGVTELHKEIRAVFSFMDGKANLIAVTETNRIWSKFYLERFKQFQIEEWTWRAAKDRFTCKYCKALDGKTFKTGEKITITMGSRKKRTVIVEHPPLHPGCRCKMIPKAKR